LLTAVAVSVVGNAAYASGAFARGAHSIPPLAAAVVIHFLAQRLRRGIAEETREAERAAQEARERAEQAAREAAAEAARIIKEQERQQRAERLASQPAKPVKARQTPSQDDSEPRGDPKDPAVIAQVLAMRAEPEPVPYRDIALRLRINKDAVGKIVKDNAENEVAA
jgi:colicin import membrane protein